LTFQGFDAQRPADTGSIVGVLVRIAGVSCRRTVTTVVSAGDVVTASVLVRFVFVCVAAVVRIRRGGRTAGGGNISFRLTGLGHKRLPQFAGQAHLVRISLGEALGGREAAAIVPALGRRSAAASVILADKFLAVLAGNNRRRQREPAHGHNIGQQRHASNDAAKTGRS